MTQEWVEVLNERRRTSKTKRLYDDGQPTNKFSLDATINPIHYKDAGDEWQAIDSDLVPSTRSITGFGNPAYEMVENEYEMFVLGTLNSGVPLVRYEAKNTEYWVQFAAHNLQWTNDLDQIDFIATPTSTPTEVSESEAKWPDAYGAGIDLRFIAGMGRMGKWLDIAAPLPAPPQYIIDGGNPVIEFAEILEFHKDLDVYVNGVKWNKKDDVSTTTEIEFRSPDGEVQFVFPMAKGLGQDELEHAVGQVHLKKQGAKLYVTIRFPWSWLQSITYPVHLDVTVDKQTGAQGDDGRRYHGTAGFSVVAVSSWLGHRTGAEFLDSEMFARWTGVTIEGTIDVSYIECYSDEAAENVPQLKVYGIDQDNPAAPTSAAEFDADPLTTAGVDWDGAWLNPAWNQSPSLNTIFQELVDTYTINNDAVMIQIKNDGGAVQRRNDCNYWDTPGNVQGPKLHIEYTVAVGVPPIMDNYHRRRVVQG